MSINSLTNRAILKEEADRSDLDNGEILEAAGAAVVALDENKVNTALDSLTKYIPTETVTLYVAAVAATPAMVSLSGYEQIGQVIYWLFFVLTPVLLVVVLMSKRASAGQPPVPSKWPWWKLVAASIAYLVWALAVPNNPYITSEAAAIVAGFGAIVVSALLSLLEPIFERPAPAV